MPASASRLFFVYGTLRQGDIRDINRMLPAPRLLGRGRVAGSLYHLGSYPGALLGGAGWIQGEVYEVAAALEAQLDEIEEVWPQQTGEYTKREATVVLDGNGQQSARPDLEQRAGINAESRELVCVLYEIAPDRIKGMPVIACGDWVARGQELTFTV